MYCANCKSIVEKQLKEENAIKKIDIDYMTDTVFVDFETSLITKEEIKEDWKNQVISLSELRIRLTRSLLEGTFGDPS